MPGDPVEPIEISRGLVLHLDPDALELEGATYSCPRPKRVQDGHFFVCVDASDSAARLWTPLFTAQTPGRQAVSTEGSSGHPKVTGGTFHFHPEQIWTATDDQIRVAAKSGLDMSRRGARNRLAADQTPTPDKSD